MTKRSQRSCHYFLPLTILFLALTLLSVLFIVQTTWKEWKNENKSLQKSSARELLQQKTHSSQEQMNSETANLNHRISDKSNTVVNGETEKNVSGSSLLTSDDKKKPRGKKESKMNDCGEGKIYFSNDLYDCDGIMRDDTLDARMNKNLVNASVKRREKDITAVRNTVKQMTPMIITPTKRSKGIKTHPSQSNTTKSNRTIARKIFINCGGTLPWAVELFIDTYPDSQDYEIYSFVMDQSLKVLYTKFPNHTFIAGTVSNKDGTQNVDLKSFGSGSEITQSIATIDLSEWLLTNTNKTDYVILRMEIEQEIEIVKHLVKTSAIKYVDKYYSTRNPQKDTFKTKVLETELKPFKIKPEFWYSKLNTYSDFDKINPTEISEYGNRIIQCRNKDTQKFAICLYSPSASANVLNTIHLLRNFAPKDRLKLTTFLPYEMFKSKFLHVESLFQTFDVGLYFDGNGVQSEEEEYTRIRQYTTFVSRIFHKHDVVFKYVMVGNRTRKATVEAIQEYQHYTAIDAGVDVTGLTSKVLRGETIKIDDTGKKDGDILLVNIDKPDTEYLVLYMMRRFVPWLIDLSECNVTSIPERSYRQEM